jgi:hypothetical protein
MRRATRSVPHSQAWTDALNNNIALPVDVIGSLREEAINHILEKHFQFDNERYTFVMQRTFNVSGVDRTFKVTVRADSPVVVDLPPFSSTAKDPEMAKRFATGGWAKLERPPRSSKLTVPQLSQGRMRLSKRAAASPNVRVFCKSLSFEIEWPKLNGGGNWTWTPTPLTVVAEAVLELNLTQDGPILHIQVLQVKFDPVHPLDIRKQVLKMIGRLPREERATLSECEEKFNDLLVIAMNIAATTYAPKLVYDIHLPVPVIANMPVKPVLLELGDKIVALGLTVDRIALTARNAALLQSTLASFEGLLSQDIEDAGGLENIVIERGWVSSGRKRGEEIVFRSASEIRARLPRAMSFVRALQKRARQRKNRQHPGGRDAAVPDALGVGANQDVLTRFARSAMPSPVNKCTDWVMALDVVRGRICWWVHIYDPVVAIVGTSVSGQVSIDIGGEIDACVRKFWDCSWSWDCGALSLAVQGKPGIQLNLQSGTGISFYGQLTAGGLTLVSNLPWPFNKVIEALSSLVIDAIIVVINAVAANIKVDILLPEFTLPKQNTKLKFSDISPFAFTRTGGQFTPAERTFIGFSIGVTATK